MIFNNQKFTIRLFSSKHCLWSHSPISSPLSARLSDVETNLGRLKIRLKAEFVSIFTINSSQTDNSSPGVHGYACAP